MDHNIFSTFIFPRRSQLLTTPWLLKAMIRYRNWKTLSCLNSSSSFARVFSSFLWMEVIWRVFSFSLFTMTTMVDGKSSLGWIGFWWFHNFSSFFLNGNNLTNFFTDPENIFLFDKFLGWVSFRGFEIFSFMTKMSGNDETPKVCFQISELVPL